jgi:hypothetical protein
MKEQDNELCTCCGNEYHNSSDISSIRIFGYCRECISVMEEFERSMP